MSLPTTTFELPYLPRQHFIPFHARKEKLALIVAHRRCGKTEACLAELITRALKTKKENAFFGYVGPFAGQAVTVAWDRLKRMLGNDFIKECVVREGEHAILLPNGAKIRLFGADNYNALRGLYWDGVILDEVADMHPDVWTQAIYPALKDRDGWAVFIGTPKGTSNFFYKQREKARINKSGRWFYLFLPNSVTGYLSPQAVEELREELDEDEFLQEVECSFEAAVKGAYYGKLLEKAREEGRLEPFKFVKGAPVHAAFDLGWSDATAAWFYQVINGRVDVLGYYEVNGLAIPDIVSEVKAKYKSAGWKVGDWWLPHDAAAKSLQTGKSIIEQMWGLGINPHKVANIEVQQGIQAVRKTLPACRIDGAACYSGLEALKSYQKKWSGKLGTFSRAPLHDWASHGSDAFRYLCLAISDQDLQSSEARRTASAAVQLDQVSGLPTSINSSHEDVSNISHITDEEFRWLQGLAFESDYERF